MKKKGYHKTRMAPRRDSCLIGSAMVVWLAKNVTLPMEDSAPFRDAMDRRIDLGLKRVYRAAGAVCRPVETITSVANTLKVWTQNIDSAIN